MPPLSLAVKQDVVDNIATFFHVLTNTNPYDQSDNVRTRISQARKYLQALAKYSFHSNSAMLPLSAIPTDSQDLILNPDFATSNYNSLQGLTQSDSLKAMEFFPEIFKIFQSDHYRAFFMSHFLDLETLGAFFVILDLNIYKKTTELSIARIDNQESSKNFIDEVLKYFKDNKEQYCATLTPESFYSTISVLGESFCRNSKVFSDTVVDKMHVFNKVLESKDSEFIKKSISKKLGLYLFVTGLELTGKESKNLIIELYKKVKDIINPQEKITLFKDAIGYLTLLEPKHAEAAMQEMQLAPQEQIQVIANIKNLEKFEILQDEANNSLKLLQYVESKLSQDQFKEIVEGDKVLPALMSDIVNPIDFSFTFEQRVQALNIIKSCDFPPVNDVTAMKKFLKADFNSESSFKQESGEELTQQQLAVEIWRECYRQNPEPNVEAGSSKKLNEETRGFGHGKP